MLRYLFIAILMIFLSATPLGNDSTLKSFWIVWNVGQGQWSTFMDENSCDHFDMGGERNPLKHVKKICLDKINRLYLSHWDWDHVSFALKAKSSLKNICLNLPPIGISSPHKMKILKAYTACSSNQLEVFSLKELTHFSASDAALRNKKNSNDFSHVLLVLEKYLIPGDSTARQENIWSHGANIQKTSFLLLGHHGSRTSTSEELLSQLPHLKVAIASARFARYGHPHQEVVQRLRRYHVILLKTEDWGNLWFEMTL